MKKCAIVAVLFALSSCAQIQETSESIGEAVGQTGAVLTTTPYRQSRPSSLEDRRFQQLVEMYFENAFRLEPHRATTAGIHKHDSEIGIYAKEDFASFLARLKSMESDLKTIDRLALSPSLSIDFEILTNTVQSDIMELEDFRPQERDPNYYLNLISQGVFSLSAREFAPAQARVQSLNARLEKVPALLAHAKKNLSNPPRIFTEIAIEKAKGTIQYLENEVPQAFSADLPAELQIAFEAGNIQAQQELRAFLEWLEKDLLPSSRGSFAIGHERFRKRLLLREMIDLSPSAMLAKGKEELDRLQSEASKITNQHFPGRTPAEALQTIETADPSGQEILETTRKSLSALKQFCSAHAIVHVPDAKEPAVRETPPFRRSLSFASMDIPGPYETQATEAFYSVTLPEAGWPEEKKEELARFFSPASIAIISAHEAYPGHFTQFLWMQNQQTMIRRLLWSTTNVEGWAHYAEEMILDEGFGGADPGLRLHQIQLALIRACRYVAAVKMHAESMTIAEATHFFMKNAYLNRTNAEREARRGAVDPDYYAYTLGKILIKKLRSDYMEKNPQSKLEGFHNSFLSLGAPPLPLARKLLFPEQPGSPF